MAASNGDVYLDVSIASKHVGRIVIHLYDDVVPLTARNFRELATGVRGFGFKGNAFHRIVSEFLVQAGDITSGDGRGGRSIYGPKFKDENFTVKHTRAGQVGMANAGRDTNNSQFYITAIPAAWLDGKHVLFGEVIEGMDVVKAIEAQGGKDGRPKAVCLIQNCGVL